jgi:hypothetical protein
MAAFWAEFTFGGSGPALTAHGSLDLKQEIQIQIELVVNKNISVSQHSPYTEHSHEGMPLNMGDIFLFLLILESPYSFIYFHHKETS